MIYMGVLRIVVYTYTRYRYEGLLGVLPFCLQQAAPRSQPKSVLMFESSNESCCCARCARETNKCLSTIKYNNHHNIHEMPATRYILSPQRIYLLCCACCVRSSWRLKHRGLDTQRKRTHSAHSSSTRSLHTPALLTVWIRPDSCTLSPSKHPGVKTFHPRLPRGKGEQNTTVQQQEQGTTPSQIRWATSLNTQQWLDRRSLVS